MSSTPSTGSFDAEPLLAHLGWIRALARELVRDPELAEDVAQETCVAALQGRPRDARKLRGWLASVLRNAVRQRLRAEGRRRVREEASARPEARPATADLVLEAAAQREVVARVLELDEPYRTTVLLRWFRDMPPRAIARAQGVSVNTVQSRLSRAHEKLRARLDDGHGGRAAWAVCALPGLAPSGALAGSGLAASGGLAPAGAGLASSLLGTLAMKLLVGFGLAAVALGAALFWVGGERRPDPGRAAPSAVPAPAAVAAHAAEAPPRGGLAGDAAAAAPAREALASAAPPPDAAAAAARPLAPIAVQGRVLGGEGQPLAGVPLELAGGALAEADGTDAAERSPEAPRAAVQSDAAGRFRFETTLEGGALVVAQPGWVTVREGVWKRGSAVEAVVVAAPECALDGRVVDAAGRPVAGAVLGYRLPADFRGRFELILDGSRERGWSARAGPDGRFAMEGAPAIEGATLLASQDGYVPARVPVPGADARGLEIVLERPSEPLEGTLRGRVVDGAGTGVAGARVALGLTSALSGPEGDFAIDLARAVTSERLCAVAAGFRPALLERPGEPGTRADGAPDSGWPDFVVLALTEPALALRGVVLDHEGTPRAGVKVWVDDPTPFAPIGMMPTTLEGLASGAPIPPQALESEANLPATDGDSSWDWTAPARSSSALWSWVQTDGEGRFDLGGLCARPYRLCALDADALRITRTPPLDPAAGEVTIRLEPPERAERLAGRVVTERGDPVPGARLSLWLPVVERGARIRGGRALVVLQQPGPRARTDAEGRFELRDVPSRGLRIDVAGDDVVPETITLAEKDDLRRLELVVSVRCHLQVVLGEDRGRADAIEVTTEDGQPLDLLVISHESVNAYTSVPLVNGTTGVVSTSSRARRLRLLLGEQVVEEHPIELYPGELNRLGF